MIVCTPVFCSFWIRVVKCKKASFYLCTCIEYLCVCFLLFWFINILVQLIIYRLARLAYMGYGFFRFVVKCNVWCV